jgi:type I restriction enzyme R subunit
MSTGVDIRDLEFIVFLRPVKSRILFEQMMGRGTRKGDRYPDKSHFTVFDCFDGTLIEYFNHATGITAEPPDRPSRTLKQIIEDIWDNKDRAYNIGCLVKRLQRMDKECSGEARDSFAQFVGHSDIAGYARDLPRNLLHDFLGTMQLLRKEEFQYLLAHHRPPRTFLVAIENEDNVSSQWLIHGLDGQDYKPEDYLDAFVQFVRDHADQIDAIKILLDRPQDWSVEALAELKKTLATAPQHFTITTLQKAHQVAYSKALVDIISMIKHALKNEPLKSVEERVDAAISRIAEARTFTDEQLRWLARIRDHLVQDLSIQQEDFDVIPVFADFGGAAKANRVFEGHLKELLVDINKAIAA